MNKHRGKPCHVEPLGHHGKVAGYIVSWYVCAASKFNTSSSRKIYPEIYTSDSMSSVKTENLFLW